MPISSAEIITPEENISGDYSQIDEEEYEELIAYESLRSSGDTSEEENGANM